MHVKLRLVVAICSLGLLIAGCGVKNKQTSIEPSGSGEKIIKIGVIAPLSGPLANNGIALRNGLTLAQEESKNPGKFKFYFEDSEYDGGKAVLAFQKLVNIDKVDLVINWGAPTAQSVAAQAANYKIPFLSITPDASITLKSPYVVRLYNKPEDQAKVALQYFKDKNISSIGVLKLENDFTNSIYNGLLKEKSADVNINLLDTVQFATTDFRTSILKLKNDKSNALSVLLCGNQIASFYKQLKEAGISNYVTMGEDCFEDLDVITASQNSMEGVVYTAIAPEKAFEDNYIKRFNSTSSLYVAGTVYDLVKILDNYSMSTVSTDSLMNALNISDYTGVMGRYSLINKDGDRFFNYPTRIREINNNSFVTIKTVY